MVIHGYEKIFDYYKTNYLQWLFLKSSSQTDQLAIIIMKDISNFSEKTILHSKINLKCIWGCLHVQNSMKNITWLQMKSYLSSKLLKPSFGTK